MKWLIVWYIVMPQGLSEIQNMPEKTFATREQCNEFGTSRTGMVELFKGEGRRTIFKCKEKL